MKGLLFGLLSATFNGMGVALELVIIPVVFMVALVVMSVWANLSVGAVFLGGLVLALLLGGLVMLLRLEWQIEEEEGVHEETGESPVPKEPDGGEVPTSTARDTTIGRSREEEASKN